MVNDISHLKKEIDELTKEIFEGAMLTAHSARLLAIPLVKAGCRRQT